MINIRGDLKNGQIQSLNLRRTHILHNVAPEYRCAAFVQPLDAGSVASRSGTDRFGGYLSKETYVDRRLSTKTSRKSTASGP